MKSMGNIKSNAIYNSNELRNPPPPNLDETERDSEIEQYIRCELPVVIFGTHGSFPHFIMKRNMSTGNLSIKMRL